MNIIQPGVEIWNFNADKILRNIEKAARVCYKSEGSITDDSYVDIIKKRIIDAHESVLEHEKITVKFIVDRGISHEIVRHRIAAYSQESTRYCNYSKAKFGNEITVIEPFFFPVNGLSFGRWEMTISYIEEQYLALLEEGASPQEARSILPNSLKTEVVVTYNIREWRHFFRLRCASTAHPQMRQVTIPLLLLLRMQLSPLFDDIEYDTSFDPNNYGKISMEDTYDV